MSAPARFIRRLLGAIVLVGAAGVIVALVSGLMASVVTDGTSMLPSHHAGDLVVVGRAGYYDIGDVVAYRDDGSGAVVLHRIIGGDEYGFDLRGDNNTSVDLSHPTADDLIGRQLLHVPRVGVVFRSRVGLAMVLGIVVLVGGALVGGRRRRPELGDADTEAVARRPVGAATASSSPPRGGRVLALRALIVVVDIAVLGGVIASFVIRPHLTTPPAVPQHTGAMSCSTQVAVDEVYPTGRVETGDPVFMRLVDRLDVSFRYRTEAPAGTAASVRMWAELSDGSGWSRTFDLAPLTAVLGPSVELGGSLDLAGMLTLVDRVTAATGMPAGPLAIDVVAEVGVVVDGSSTPFRVEMPLWLNQTVLRVADETAVTDTDDGPGIVVASAVDGSTASVEPYESGGMPTLVRRGLFGLLIVMGAVTVVGWPQRPAASTAGLGAGPTNGEPLAPATVREHTIEPEPPLRAPSVSVGRLVLPSSVVLVDVASVDALHQLAVANAVPVFESDDGEATVITGLAVHRWRPPAATPTLELPAVGRRLFDRTHAPAAPAVTPVEPPADARLGRLVGYLADPVVNHQAEVTTASARPSTRDLRRSATPDERPDGLA